MAAKCNLSKYERFIGKRNNKLTVIGVDYVSETVKRASLVCKCDCGNIKKVLPNQFESGKTKGCGTCWTTAKIVDGRSLRNPDIYRVWLGILYRCENENASEFYRYGGRGIKVCDEWHDYLNFEEWVLSKGGLKDGFSIDRIDNSGNYGPDNCRFATVKEQSRNRDSNTVIEYDGHSMCLAEWAEYLNINYKTLAKRYYRGWSTKRMFNQPVNKYSRKSQ